MKVITDKEKSRLKFRMQAHLSLKRCHIAVYVNDEYGININVKTNVKTNGDFGKSSRLYSANCLPGKTYEDFDDLQKDYNEIALKKANESNEPESIH